MNDEPRPCDVGQKQEEGGFPKPLRVLMAGVGRLGECLALLVCLALLNASAARAERVHPRAGTSSAAFLKVGVGARPAAMGEAFTAAADDIYSIYWNPAGLSDMGSRRLDYSHHESFQGIRHLFLGYGHPWGDKSVFGLGFNSQFVPSDLEKRSGLNEADPFNPITPSEGTFGAYDMALSLTYGRKLWAGHSLGSTVKLIHQDIGGHVGHSGALDLGWKWREALPNLSLGASVLNIGPGVKFQSRHDLPFTVRTGAAYLVKRWRSLVAFDLSVPRDDYPLLAWGVETGPWNFLVLRTGYQYRLHGNPTGALSGWRVGMGLVHRSLSLDYAVAPLGHLGLSHRISLGWRFAANAGSSAAGRPSGVDAASGQGLAEAGEDRDQAAPAPAPAPPPSAKARLARQAPSGTMRPGATSSLDKQTIGRAFSYSVSASVTTVSERGTDYEVQALAPSEELELRVVRFRTRHPDAQSLRLLVSEMQAPGLPEGVEARKAYRLRSEPRTAAREGSLLWKGGKGSGLIFFGLWSGRWTRLRAELVHEGDKTFWRAGFDELPEAVAAGSSPRNPSR